MDKKEENETKLDIAATLVVIRGSVTEELVVRAYSSSMTFKWG
jgi:hypothetical protein